MAYYAVASGREIGIYDTWSKCEEQVKGFKNAKYKKFQSHEEAASFIKAAHGSSSKQALFSPQDFAVPLGKKGTVCWKEKEKQHANVDVKEFWPEPENDASNESKEADVLWESELLAAAFEAENLSNSTASCSASATASSTKRKRKVEDTSSSCTKRLKHASKIWEPVELKKIGNYDFHIDEEGYVIVYTDGSCINNGGANASAGYGVYFGDGHPLNAAKPVQGRVTNNVGEIQAAIHAVKVAKNLRIPKICISTDSQFLINAITSWIGAWKRKGWQLKGGGAVKNIADFKELDELLNDEAINVKWNYVKAHKGIHGNEMADKLAREGSDIYRQKHKIK